MRNDVKLGVVIAVALVGLGGLYFLGGGEDEPAIPLVADQSYGEGADSALQPAVRWQEPADAPLRDDGFALLPPADEPAREREPALVSGRDGAIAPEADDPETVELTSSRAGRRAVSLTATRQPEPPDPIEEVPVEAFEPDESRFDPAGALPGESVTGVLRASLAESDEGRPGSDPAVDGPAVDPAETDGAVETHRIKRGDTLSGLAKTYYGSEAYVNFLLKANLHIADKSHLSIGTLVRLPRLPDSARYLPNGGRTNRVQSDRGLPVGQRSGAARTYVVQQRDTLYAIAKRFLGSGSRWQDIYDLNRDVIGTDAKRLVPGQTLKLPQR